MEKTGNWFEQREFVTYRQAQQSISYGMGIMGGIMNAKQYIDILKSNLLSTANKLRLGNNFTFYQDNDPIHKAHKALVTFQLWSCSRNTTSIPAHKS
ncbi:hypothetical protein QE152_g33773 [Popillia japonica]|uniref:Transposase n=1 Tax=Popillia japonica TaxID=7064 RepID=A0AAW1IW75_POPJA